jgi:hypothetical protein
MAFFDIDYLSKAHMRSFIVYFIQILKGEIADSGFPGFPRFPWDFHGIRNPGNPPFSPCFKSYSLDSHRVYIVFVGFTPCLHRIHGIPTLFTSYSRDSHLVYIIFSGFPPCLHHIPGFPTVFTSYS